MSQHSTQLHSTQLAAHAALCSASQLKSSGRSQPASQDVPPPLRHGTCVQPLTFLSPLLSHPSFLTCSLLALSSLCRQALEREGVDTLFAYPGGASMEIHQALTRSDTIRNILCRHEQVG